MPIGNRPEHCAGLLPRVQGLRARTARSHWLVFDEAHHLLPASWTPASSSISESMETTILITVHPDHVSPTALKAIDALLVTGKAPMQTLSAFAKAVGIAAPQGEEVKLEKGEVLLITRASKLSSMNIDRTIAEIEYREQILVLPDTRPLS